LRLLVAIKCDQRDSLLVDYKWKRKEPGRKMREVAKLLATLCAGIFFGAALYISLVQHPATLEAGSDFAARFFRPMYGRAALLQAPIALIGCVAGIVAWLKGAGRLWLVAGLLLGSV
jgi:hypothetical protein